MTRFYPTDHLYTHTVMLRHARKTIAAMEKQQVLHIVCVCVCSLSVIQHAKNMHCIKLSSAACLAQQHFSTLSH
jgi:hypothetical protein